MSGSKEKFDLIFSLGGNCAAANNLRYRGLRLFSLPFDWLAMSDNYTLQVLPSCFEDDFKKFLLKENLVELPKQPNGEHADTVHYIDTYTGYSWLNHFYKKREEDNEYERVKAKLDSRLSRLYKTITQSKKVLCILNTNFEIDIDLIFKLEQTLKKKFPNTIFFFRLLEFNSSSNSLQTIGSVTIQKIKRPIEHSDFVKTTSDWNFLDNVDLTFSTKFKAKYLARLYKMCVKFSSYFILSSNKRKAYRKRISNAN